MSFSKLWSCIFGPDVHYRIQTTAQEGWTYEPSVIEALSDRGISVFRICYNVLYTFSPLILIWLYRRGDMGREGVVYWTTFGVLAVVFMWPLYTARGFGRYFNPQYSEFIAVLEKAKISSAVDNIEKLREYDFDVSGHFPVTYRWQNITPYNHNFEVLNRGLDVGYLHAKFNDFLCQLIGHKLAYPGSTSILNFFMKAPLLRERKVWIEERNAVRNRLLTHQNDEIDTAFIDKRGKSGTGNTLILCSEGNAAFWEAGCMTVPYKKGFSVLGWNRPGFSGSSGLPFPPNEKAAVECVFQFAVEELNFEPKDIVMFAWSIGGFSVSWIAAKYPGVRAVVMDATFDSIDELAKKTLPELAHTAALSAIKTHMDLNVAENIKHFNGPLRLVRRTKDEIIATEQSDVGTNRGNFLLEVILKHRYPELFNENSYHALMFFFRSFASAKTDLLREFDALGEDILLSIHNEHTSLDVSERFPSSHGKGLTDDDKISHLLALAHYYQIDFESTHCTPLDESLFSIPFLAV